MSMGGYSLRMHLSRIHKAGMGAGKLDRIDWSPPCIFVYILSTSFRTLLTNIEPFDLQAHRRVDTRFVFIITAVRLQ